MHYTYIFRKPVSPTRSSRGVRILSGWCFSSVVWYHVHKRKLNIWVSIINILERDLYIRITQWCSPHYYVREGVSGQRSAQHSFNTLHLKTLKNGEIESIFQHLFFSFGSPFPNPSFTLLLTMGVLSGCHSGYLSFKKQYRIKLNFFL